LSDGTRVWLNAASSIRFPVVFTGNNRSVTLNGEAYFEVAKNAQKPFVVTVGNTTVTVLGTHFNINAYPDEGSMKTTLLEGSVQVTEGTHSVLVQPGEQALEDDNGRLTAVPANTALAVAWRNGYFQFEEADLKAVLRQIGRWYDLDIVYEGPVTDHLYAGKLERSVPLSAILLFLSSGNIHYRLEGKRLVIE
jgi:ferric-dicitrate binding protein FerR (iron transport regulator)